MADKIVAEYFKKKKEKKNILKQNSKILLTQTTFRNVQVKMMRHFLLKP